MTCKLKKWEMKHLLLPLCWTIKSLEVLEFSGRETYTDKLPNWDTILQKNTGERGS